MTGLWNAIAAGTANVALPLASSETTATRLPATRKATWPAIGTNTHEPTLPRNCTCIRWPLCGATRTNEAVRVVTEATDSVGVVGVVDVAGVVGVVGVVEVVVGVEAGRI